MYLIINNNRYTVSRRIVTDNTIKYFSVEPTPETISGTITMYSNDGFLLSEDNADTYARRVLNGSILELTNAPEPEPPQPPTEEQLAAEARAKRDRLLAETDWTQILDTPIDDDTRDAYRVYRQELRDIPEQEGFPYSIEWPELPAVTNKE